MTTMSATTSRVGLATRKAKTGRVISEFALPILILVVLIVASITTQGFAEPTNFRAILINTAITGIAAVGMTAVTLSGNFFSLGVGPTVILSGILFLALADTSGSVAVAFAATIAVALLLGTVQALIVAAGLNPVITTLAFGTIVYGCVAVWTGGEVVTAGAVQVTWLATSDILGLPLPVVVFIVLTTLVALLSERTVLGRQMRLLGENRETAVMSGISVTAVTAAAFGSMSIGAALAGVFSASQLRQMQANDLPNLTMDIIAAVLVGGAAISGGEASPIRSALGALLLVILGNVMLLQGYSPGVRVFGVGVVVVFLMVALHLVRKAGAR